MYINRPNKKRHILRDSVRSSSNSNGGGGGGSTLRPVAKFRFKQGDLVRVSYNRHTFERSFNQRFSEEAFRIRQRILRENIPVYLLADLKGAIIKGFFYGPELQKISQSDQKLYKMEKILKRRGKGSNREALIRWAGYPPSFDSWQKLSSVESI